MSVRGAVFGWLPLAPPAVTVFVAVSTRRIPWALSAGVACGAAIVADFQPLASAERFFRYILAVAACPEKVKMVLFVLLLGGLLELLFASGAFQQLAEVLARYLNSARKARLATWLMGLCLSFDDHAEVLLTGSAMRSVMQRHRVAPALLAYLCSTLAGVASLTLLSTWFVYQNALLVQAATNIGELRTASTLFLVSLPYHLPTYLSIFLAFLIAYTGRWFGHLSSEVPEGWQSLGVIRGKGAHYLHAGVPLITLGGSLIAGLLASGYWMLPPDSRTRAGIGDYLGAAPVVDTLLGATGLTLVLSLVMLLKDRVLPPRAIYQCLRRGVQGMVSVGLIILLAQALSLVIADLNTGTFIVLKVQESIDPVTLPACVYAVTLLISVATGSSWSAMALIMPIAFQLAAALQCTELLPLMAAVVVSGSLSLAPVIPYSDTVMITSAVCGLPPLTQARMQLPHVVLVVLVALGAFLLLGFQVPLMAVHLIALTVIAVLHLILARKVPAVPGCYTA